MPSEPGSDLLLTLVLSSRNDRYDGNPVWRLQTTLNVAARNVCEAHLMRQVELIVTDWGSEVPLQEVVKLSDEARVITRFLEVPPEVARREKKDSPFPEVLANNAAIRRARGRFIGKIDQDTLVDKAFFSGLFAAVDGTGKDFLESSFLFAGRRSIPRKLTVRSPSGEEVLDFLDCFVRWLPKEGRGRTPWFDVPTGIVVLHRRIWWEAGGYDERLLYWGFMEAELAMHLQSKYPLVDFEKLVGCPFYHLRHSTRRLTLTTRRKNPRVPPAPRQPDENWGLAQYDLKLVAPEPSAAADRTYQRPPGRWLLVVRYLPSLLKEWFWETALACLRRLFRPLQRCPRQEIR